MVYLQRLDAMTAVPQQSRKLHWRSALLAKLIVTILCHATVDQLLL